MIINFSEPGDMSSIFCLLMELQVKMCGLFLASEDVNDDTK